MALTPSAMLPLGTPAPVFTLPDTRDEMRPKSLEQVRGKAGLLVMFISNHCPYVKHIRQGLLDLAEDYAGSGVGIVAICANDADQYPDDSPAHMAQQPYPFPYLYDQSQETAHAYQAACTPDFFLFDALLKLVYRGRFDASTPGSNQAVTGIDLREALDDMLAGRKVTDDQYPSMGCNIKWRQG